MVEYKIIEYEDIDYSLLGEFFQKTWFPYERADNGVVDFDAKDLENIFKLFKSPFLVGAFDGEKLIGHVSAHEQRLCLGTDSVKGMNAMFLWVLDAYRKKGIALTLINKLQAKAEELGYEIILAGPEKKGKGDQVLKKAGWILLGKFQSRVAFPVFNKIADLKGLNVIERAIGGKLASEQPNVPGIGDGFQEASESDFSEIVALLNSNPAPIKRCWTVDSYKKFLVDAAYYNPKSYIWKKGEKIVATGIVTINRIHWNNGDGYGMFLRQFNFDSILPAEERTRFFGEMMNLAKSHEKDIIALKMPCGDHIRGALKLAHYMGDQKGRILCIYPISERAKQILTEKEIKRFYFDMI